MIRNQQVGGPIPLAGSSNSPLLSQESQRAERSSYQKPLSVLLLSFMLFSALTSTQTRQSFSAAGIPDLEPSFLDTP